MIFSSKSITVGAMGLFLTCACGRPESPNHLVSGWISLSEKPVFIFEFAEPPALVPPGPGAGPWNSESPSRENVALAKFLHKSLGTSAARSTFGREAADTFEHYFDNDGNLFAVNASRLFDAVPRIEMRFQKTLQSLLDQSSSLPDGSYPFTMREALHDAVPKSENENWYLATNAFSWFIHGELTREAGNTAVRGHWRLWDRYDWDPGVVVPIRTPFGTIRMDQNRVGEFHRQGLAREYDLVADWSFECMNEACVHR